MIIIADQSSKKISFSFDVLISILHLFFSSFPISDENGPLFFELN